MSYARHFFLSVRGAHQGARRAWVIFALAVPLLFVVLVRNATSYADLGLNAQFVAPDHTRLAVDVSSDGQVLVDGVRAYRALRLISQDGNVELRLPLVSEPGFAIENVQAIVTFPKTLKIKNPQDVAAMIVDEHGVGNTTIRVSAPNQLIYQAYELSSMANLTIVARLPEGIVTLPLLQRILFASASSWIFASVGVLVLTVLILLVALVRQWKSNRVLHSNRTVLTPPFALAPAISGAVIDGKVGAREIAATLVDLANRGFLYITRRGNDFVFARRKNFVLEGPVRALSELPLPGSADVMPLPPASGVVSISHLTIDQTHRLAGPAVGMSTDLRHYEKILLSKLFNPQEFRASKQMINVRVGRHVFSRRIAQVYWEIYQEATNLGYFEENPSRVHVRFRIAGLLLFFTAVAGLLLGILIPDPKYPLLFWIATLIASTLVIGISGLMNIHTPAGKAATETWLAFRNFLTDETPIAYSADAPELFVRYLPYAIAFGIEGEWAQRFLHLTFRPPDWFNSTQDLVSLENFIAAMFPIVHSISEMFAEIKEPIVQ